MNAAPFAPAARWCWHALTPSGTSGFFLFRREFRLDAPATLRLRVSADNRYNFYVDGQLLGRGPARGDLAHYRYETYEVALGPGAHALAAEVLVWSLPFNREAGPWSEIHTGGGFLCEVAGAPEELSTPAGWLGAIDPSRRHAEWDGAVVPAPPCEDVDFSRAPAFADGSWRLPGAAGDDAGDPSGDGAWLPVKDVGAPFFAANYHGDPCTRWHLEPSPLPQLAAEPWAPAVILDGPGGESASGLGLRLEDGALVGDLPAGRHAVILDLGRNQTSFLTLQAAGGAGCLRLAYAEGLFVDGRRGARGPVAGGGVGPHGYADRLRLAGGAWRFAPFWYRAGRYLEISWDLDAPAPAFSLRVAFATFPFARAAVVALPGRPDLAAIYATSWHTARCCAHEHYEDCPYWEQMQYTGDTRIQALISYAVTGDDRLGRQAVRQFDDSRLPCGLTQSRYPTNYPQVIPQFSLFWVMMVADHWRWHGDDAVLRERWQGVNAVLDWFERRRRPDGLIGPVGYWNITDWSPAWPGGCSDRGEHDLPETIISLLYAECCRVCERLARAAALPDSDLARRAALTLRAVRAHCFSPAKGLFQDVPGRDWHSQHVNALAVLCGAARPEEQGRIIDAVLHDEALAPCTLYFAFYVLEALRRAGRESDFEEYLRERWQPMLDLGFTTFPECPDLATRSDCHAWSAAPAYQMLRFYGGLTPAFDGLDGDGADGGAGAAADAATVILRPRCGSLSEFAATMPVGRGRWLRLAWRREAAALDMTLTAESDLAAVVALPGGAPRRLALAAGRPASARLPLPPA